MRKKNKQKMNLNYKGIGVGALVKVKNLIEKLQKLDQDGDLVLLIRDKKRPHSGSGTIIPIKDIGIFTSVDQDSNDSSYALDIKKNV